MNLSKKKTDKIFQTDFKRQFYLFRDLHYRTKEKSFENLMILVVFDDKKTPACSYFEERSLPLTDITDGVAL